MKFAPLRSAFGSAALATLALTSVCAADGPVISFGMTSPSVTGWNAAGTATGNPNEYSYAGAEFGENWAVSYSLTATDTSEQSLAILGGAISVLNTSNSAQMFSLTIILPTFAQGNGSMSGGSVSGVLTGDIGGGAFSSARSTAIWTAFMLPAGGGDPFVLASLLNDPFQVFADPLEVANIPGESFGNPIPNLPSPTMGDGIGITLNFLLGAGDKVDFTTALVMNAVPGPGGLALLALVGGTRSRRRR